MKLSTYHAQIKAFLVNHGIRASAKAAGLNPMRVSRFCNARGGMIGRIPIEDWVLLVGVVRELSAGRPELPLSELDL